MFRGVRSYSFNFGKADCLDKDTRYTHIEPNVASYTLLYVTIHKS